MRILGGGNNYHLAGLTESFAVAILAGGPMFRSGAFMLPSTLVTWRSPAVVRRAVAGKYRTKERAGWRCLRMQSGQRHLILSKSTDGQLPLGLIVDVREARIMYPKQHERRTRSISRKCSGQGSSRFCVDIRKTKSGWSAISRTRPEIIEHMKEYRKGGEGRVGKGKRGRSPIAGATRERALGTGHFLRPPSNR